MASRIGAGLVCALVAAASLHGQARFEVASRETVGSVSGLEIVTVRDTALNACYTLFVFRPVPELAPPRVDTTTVQEAASERDRKLAALSEEFERGLPGAVPATLGANPLKYEWEGDKVQSDYERLVREREMARLEERLDLIAGEPRIAVAGPAPCEAAAPSRR